MLNKSPLIITALKKAESRINKRRESASVVYAKSAAAFIFNERLSVI